MKPFPHFYSSWLSGRPYAYAELHADGVPALRAAAPPQFDGPGDAWSPEQLFLAAIESCFLFTLRAVAGLSKIEFVNLELDTEGTVDRREGSLRFTDIVLRGTLSVPSGTDRSRALAVLEKTKSACLVSASISTLIRLEVDIREVSVSPLVRAAS